MRNAISFRTDYQNASAWGGQDDPVVEFMLCGEFFLIRESLYTWVSLQVEEWKFDPRVTRADHVDVLLDRDVIAELNDHHVLLVKLCACYHAGRYGWWFPGTEALVNDATAAMLA